MELTPRDLKDLQTAKRLLENPSLAARVTDVLGTPIESSLDLLPEKWTQSIHQAVQTALNRALEVAIRSLDHQKAGKSWNRFHRVAVMATGATGGSFGLAGLVVELPISTTLMLRSIADIARSEGEPIQEIQSQLACLEVFALGGKSKADDATETGYLAVRSALAKTISEAARHLAEKGLASRSAPALVRFISTIASRFGIVVSEKAAAMAIPVVGAAGGAAINSIFITHFQDVARGHFIVRRLERKYSLEYVQAEYRRLSV